MRTVDLFCGCGGMSLGFQNAGHNVVAAFDNWRQAVACHRRNFSHTVVELDLSDVDAAVAAVAEYSPEMIIGGPPCQDFSHAGNRLEGARADLTYSYAKIIVGVRPRYFVMENVARVSSSAAYKKAVAVLRTAYGLTEKVLDASFCGVPQNRKRFFCIGGLGEEDGFLDMELSSFQSVLPLSVRKYYEQNGYSLPFDYYYRHPRTYKRRAVFSVDEPAPTIRGVNRPKPEGYRRHPADPVEPDGVVQLTYKDRARIQTFPDWFDWGDNPTAIEQMIGNAVPVKLAEYVASCIDRYSQGEVSSHDLRFIDWLKEEKHFTHRAANDILSRVKRADRILPLSSGAGCAEYITALHKCDDFGKIQPSIQSQIKRAVRLCCEYQDKRSDLDWEEAI